MIKVAETNIFKAFLFLIIFLNVFGTIEFFMPALKKGFSLIISLLLSHFLVPSIRYINGRDASGLQIKWMFLKKPLLLSC